MLVSKLYSWSHDEVLQQHLFISFVAGWFAAAHHMNRHDNPMTIVTIRYATHRSSQSGTQSIINHIFHGWLLIDWGFQQLLWTHTCPVWPIRVSKNKCHLRSVWEYPSAVTFHWMSTPRRASTGHTPRMTQVNQHTGLFGATCSGKCVIRILPPFPTVRTLVYESLDSWLSILLIVEAFLLLKIKHK